VTQRAQSAQSAQRNAEFTALSLCSLWSIPNPQFGQFHKSRNRSSFSGFATEMPQSFPKMSRYPPGGYLPESRTKKVENRPGIGTEFAHLTTLNNNLTRGELQGKKVVDYFVFFWQIIWWLTRGSRGLARVLLSLILSYSRLISSIWGTVISTATRNASAKRKTVSGLTIIGAVCFGFAMSHISTGSHLRSNGSWQLLGAISDYFP